MSPSTQLSESSIEQFSPAMAESYQLLYQRVNSVIPAIEWAHHLPYIDAINRLKKERNAVILAHNYQTPEIFHGVADISGDSLALAKKAKETDADIIILCGVHFMAETAKLLNPNKRVYIPDHKAGCSLAESITGEDVRLLKKKHPGVPVVSYVNTSADVKAETDLCCTSGNAVEAVESLGVDEVIFLPDQYLGKYVASRTTTRLILWQGQCEVHERFTASELQHYRKEDPKIHILAHPECPPEVLEEADFVGSTAGMIHHLGQSQPQKVVMITECSMSDNVAVEFPKINFVRPCNLCPHMKRITLPKILHTLETLENEILIDPEIAKKAVLSVQRMLEVSV